MPDLTPERIAACLEACTGIPTEALEAGALSKLFSAVSDVLATGGVDPTGRGYVIPLAEIQALGEAIAGLQGEATHAP